jgi:hypothetical protein
VWRVDWRTQQWCYIFYNTISNNKKYKQPHQEEEEQQQQQQHSTPMDSMPATSKCSIRTNWVWKVTEYFTSFIVIIDYVSRTCFLIGITCIICNNFLVLNSSEGCLVVLELQPWKRIESPFSKLIFFSMENYRAAVNDQVFYNCKKKKIYSR